MSHLCVKGYEQSAGCGAHSALQYGRWGERVNVCVHVAFLCVFSVPHEVKARRGWVMSYSLRETDGDAGVYISTVCVSVFVNPCALDMPAVFHEYRRHLFTSYCTACDKEHIQQSLTFWNDSQFVLTHIQCRIVSRWQFLLSVQSDASKMLHLLNFCLPVE